MIDYTGQEQERLPIGSVYDDSLFFGANKPLLEQIKDLLHLLVRGQTRAEIPAPIFIQLANGRTGAVAGLPYQSTTRLRVAYVYIANISSGQAVWGLRIGSNVISLYGASSGGTGNMPFAFPYTIAEGQDVVLWDVTNNQAADGSKLISWIIAYPELETVTP